MYYVAEGFSSMCVEYGVLATYFLAKTPGQGRRGRSRWRWTPAKIFYFLQDVL